MTHRSSTWENEQLEKAEKIEKELNAAHDKAADTIVLFEYYHKHCKMDPEHAKYKAEQTLWAIDNNHGKYSDGSEVPGVARAFLQAERIAENRVYAPDISETDPLDGFMTILPPKPRTVTIWPEDLH